jgi:hypothetical protein
MHTYNISSTSALDRLRTFGRVILAGVFVLAAVSVRGQAQPQKQDSDANRTHWHKYVNRQYGFSLWYPNTYRPMDADEGCMDNEYRRYLLCLQRRDDLETKIWVAIIIAAPFQVTPDRGGNMATRVVIGHHVFYWNIVGSQAVGEGDGYDLNLKGRNLEFQFDPAQIDTGSTALPPFELKMLKTFRTF